MKEKLTVTINHTELPIKEYKGKRVVTLKEIDIVHERPEGTARRNFNTNKEHLIEAVDFFQLDQPDEIRTLGIERPQGGTPQAVTLITESGYLMLVKSFTDDLAWEVQRQLVNIYFRVVEAYNAANMSKELQAILMLDSRTVQHEQRITALEQTMVVDYGQQRTFTALVNSVVVTALGGTDSPAYNNRSVRGKTYSECNHDIQKWFLVNSRNNIPRKRFEEAVEYIRNWRPSTNMTMLIRQANEQTQFYS